MRTEPAPGPDAVGLAFDPIGYRVRFWSEALGPGLVRTVEEWKVSDVDDSHSVHRWAVDKAEGRDFEIFATVDRPEGVVYIRISGVDGDADSGTSLTIILTKDS